MRISGLVTAVLLVCLTAFLFSCQSGSSGETTTTTNNNTPASTAADYKVTVVDYKGNAVNDVIVNILQNGSNKGMKVLSNGEAVFSLEKGDYTVELTFTGAGSSYSYDKAECTLSAEKTSATIHVYNKPSASESIYARTDMEQEHKEYKAQIITEGGSLVELSASDRNFFLFVPSQGGTYKISCESSSVILGYYGSTFNVLTENQAEKDGNALVLDIQNSMIGGVWVIGADTDKDTSCVFTIERVGDPKEIIENIPWVPYTENKIIDYYASCANRVSEGFTYLDLTDDTLKVVLSSKDGYYHVGSEDGPVVFITLDKGNEYLDSIQTVCSFQRMGVIVYDEKGNLVEKQSFNELFEQYSFGTVPLTEKLAYAIKSFGEARDWWDFSTQNHIFHDNYLHIVQENAWLFACGTFEGERDVDAGTKASPITVTCEERTCVYLASGKSVWIELGETNNRIVKISTVNTQMKVLYNGQEYTPSASGVIEIECAENVNELTLVGDNSGVGDYLSIEITVK